MPTLPVLKKPQARKRCLRRKLIVNLFKPWRSSSSSQHSPPITISPLPQKSRFAALLFSALKNPDSQTNNKKKGTEYLLPHLRMCILLRWHDALKRTRLLVCSFARLLYCRRRRRRPNLSRTQCGPPPPLTPFRTPCFENRWTHFSFPFLYCLLIHAGVCVLG